MAKRVGTLGLSNAVFAAIIEEVAEEAAAVRQTAYDATMDILGETATPEEIAQFIATLGSEGFAQLASQNPDAAADVMQQLRRGYA